MSNEEQEIIAEGWVEEPVRWPAHTRLYHLEPIGMGTPWMESLTSYLTRLAAAHHVHPRRLLSSECIPYLRRAAQAKTDELRHGAISAFLATSSVLNGFAPAAQQLVQGLTILTGRDDLHWLTLLPFQKIVSSMKLLRSGKAWCPQCFEIWREQGKPICEPLLWSLDILGVCPFHGQLQTCCPFQDCAQTSVALTAQAQVGFCPWCHRWLGAQPQRRYRLPGGLGTWQYQQRIAMILGDVLANMPLLPYPLSRDKMMKAISSSIDRTFNGNYGQAASHLRTTELTLRRWLRGKKTLQISSLLSICLSLDVSLVALLDGSASEASVAQQSIAVQPVSKRPPHESRKFPKRKVEKALREALLTPADPPISLNKLAKCIGSSPDRISYYFPELSAQLTSSYQAYMQDKKEQAVRQNRENVYQAILFLHENGVYPSRQRLKQVVSKPSIITKPNIVTFIKATLREMGYM